MNASKKVPKQVIDFEKGKMKNRRSIGVRWPNNIICQVLIYLNEYIHVIRNY